MTNRERLLAIMDGEMPDRIPWIPRLLIWHRAQVKMGVLLPKIAPLLILFIIKSIS